MIRTLLRWLFRFVGTYYIFEGAFNLMTYPNDLTFIGGVLMIGLLGVYWIHVIIETIVWFEYKFKENNEES